MKKFLSKVLIATICCGFVLPSLILSSGTKAMAASSIIVSKEIDSFAGVTDPGKVNLAPDADYAVYNNVNDYIQVKSFDTSGKSGTIYKVLAKIVGFADNSYVDDTLRIASYDADGTTLLKEYPLGVDVVKNVSTSYVVDITDSYSSWSWDSVKDMQLRSTFLQVGVDDCATISIDAIKLEVRTDDSNPTVNVYKPEAGSVYKGGETATIMWSASDVDTWIKYGGITLDYSADNGATWNNIASSVINNPQQRDWVTPKLTSNQVKVRVTAEDGTGHITSAISGTFLINSTAMTPTNLIATAGDKKVDLSWDAVSGANYYNIYYRKSSEVNYTGPVSVSANQTSIINLENGVNYYFIVRAIGSDGIESLDSGIWAMPTAPKVVLVSVAKTAVVAPATTTPSISAPQESAETEVPIAENEQGQIKSAEIEEPTVEEEINWTPWIILFILIVLAGAATGGYFYWFGKDEEDEIITKEVIKKSEKPTESKVTKKPEAKNKSRRW